jgi:hypothetical protein
VNTVRKLLLPLLATVALARAADPGLLSLAMPDARVAIGIDIGRMRSSPFGQGFSTGMQQIDPDLQKLLAAAGFDPLRDLEELLIVSPGASKDAPVLLMARGNFNTARLRSFAELAGSKVSSYEGVQILSDPEKKSGGFALLDGATVIAGNVDQLRAAISRRGRGVVLNAELATKIEALSSRYDAWMVSLAPVASLASEVPEPGFRALAKADVLKGIEQFGVGIGLSYDLTFATEIVTRTDKEAGALADGIQMLLAMVEKNIKDQPAAMEALKSLDFGVEGRTLKIGFTVPQAEVQKAMQAAWNTRAKPAVKVAARPAQPAVQPVVQPAVQPVRQPPEARRPAPPPPVRQLPPNIEIMIQSSPKDMGTVVIVGGKK